MVEKNKIFEVEIAIIIFFIVLYLVYMKELADFIRYLFNDLTAILPLIASIILGFGWIICIFLAGAHTFEENVLRKKFWLKIYKKLTKILLFWITPLFIIFLLVSYATIFLIKYRFVFITFIILIILGIITTIIKILSMKKRK